MLRKRDTLGGVLSDAVSSVAAPSPAPNKPHGGASGVAHHHHHHHHKHDPAEALALLSGEEGHGSLVALIALAANVLLCIVKGVAGYALNSAVLVAEATHSLSDTLSDLIALFCWRKSRRAANARYPFGYGKLETLGSLGISVALLCGAGGVALHSCSRLAESIGPMPTWVTHALSALSTPHSHHGHHAHGAGALDPSAVWYAVLSIVVKEALYQYMSREAQRLRSSVLSANAYHQRSESLASLVSLVAIAGSLFGVQVLDPLGGLVASLMIGKEGGAALLNSLRQLCDHSVDEATQQTLAKALDAGVAAAVKDGHVPAARWSKLRAVPSGSAVHAQAQFLLPAETALAAAVRAEERVRAEVRRVMPAVTELSMEMTIMK